MSVSYDRLWKLLIDRKISKGELIELCEIPSGTMNKIRNDELIHLKVIDRICGFLDCNIEDVVEIKRDNKDGLTY
jgi:DNA-binding Xre family transcriptional regulator